jgi:hypothetical protein
LDQEESIAVPLRLVGLCVCQVSELAQIFRIGQVLFIYIELILHDATSKEKHIVRRSLEPV